MKENITDILVADIGEHIKISDDQGPAPEQFNNEFDSDCTSASGVLFSDQGISIKNKVEKVVQETIGAHSTVSVDKKEL